MSPMLSTYRLVIREFRSFWRRDCAMNGCYLNADQIHAVLIAIDTKKVGFWSLINNSRFRKNGGD